MATVHILQAGEPEGAQREGDPLPRPYVTLKDGTEMSYKEWMIKRQPS